MGCNFEAFFDFGFNMRALIGSFWVSCSRCNDYFEKKKQDSLRTLFLFPPVNHFWVVIRLVMWDIKSCFQKDRLVLCSLFFYGQNLFRLGLTGVEAILPHYLFALDIILIESAKLRWFCNFIPSCLIYSFLAPYISIYFIVHNYLYVKSRYNSFS